MQLKLDESHPQLPNQQALKPLLLSLIKPKINAIQLLQGKLAFAMRNEFRSTRIACFKHAFEFTMKTLKFKVLRNMMMTDLLEYRKLLRASESSGCKTEKKQKTVQTLKHR
jgi:hypothetical protein